MKAVNVFHYLTYEGAVDIDAISDPVVLNSTIGIINNFGQTPKQIFKRPHPARKPPRPLHANMQLSKLSNLERLVCAAFPLRELGRPVGGILFHADKFFCAAKDQVLLPPNFTRMLEYSPYTNAVMDLVIGPHPSSFLRSLFSVPFLFGQLL